MISNLSTVSAEASKSNGGGGVNYVVRMTIEGPGGTGVVQTVWAVNPGEDTHLVTAYPARRRGNATIMRVRERQRAKFALHEPVVLVVQKDGHQRGLHGTVVDAYPDNDRYTVELFDDDGETLDLVECLSREIRRR